MVNYKVPLARTRKNAHRLLPNAGWKLHDAKARFSELVRRARTEGPQRVTVRGHDSVVVIAAEELERHLPPNTEALPLRYAHGEFDR
ncbi:MAG: type II toxin-antitoxin system Phd/YefM family antitoxin [Acetobacteraceae bacterium]